jgi:hypothetical protein
MMAPCCLSTMPKENKNWIVPLVILLAISQIASLLSINYQPPVVAQKKLPPTSQCPPSLPIIFY